MINKKNLNYHFNIDDYIDDLIDDNEIYNTVTKISKEVLLNNKLLFYLNYINKLLKTLLNKFIDLRIKSLKISITYNEIIQIKQLIHDGAIFKANDNDKLWALIDFYLKIIIGSGRADLNWIDVSLVTDMSKLFYALSIACDISKWDVSHVKNMSRMFDNTYFEYDANRNLITDITKWKTDSVENTDNMFYRSNFNLDISNWDMSHVYTMLSMFESSHFNLDISKWKFRKDVDVNMSYMFYSSHFNLNISNWDIYNNTTIQLVNKAFNKNYLPKLNILRYKIY